MVAKNLSGRFKPAGYKWYLGLVVVLVLALGWAYPLLGFVVPLVMLTAMVTGVFRGRHFCGHHCPRGSFFDTWLALAGRRRAIPFWLRDLLWRLVLLIGTMSFMVWRLSANPTDPLHWGRVFWQMCVLTTVVGVPLGLYFRPRAWCAMCPMGTMQMALGGQRRRWQLDAERCVSCGACQKVCPLSLPVTAAKEAGHIGSPDCLKCGLCAQVCPRGAIQPPGSAV